MVAQAQFEIQIAKINRIENLCPVCGYEMDEPPADFNICPSCGTEFGLSTVNATVEALRVHWLQSGPSGPQWWSASDEKPADWNPYVQLSNVRLDGVFSTSQEQIRTGEVEEGRPAWKVLPIYTQLALGYK